MKQTAGVFLSRLAGLALLLTLCLASVARAQTVTAPVTLSPQQEVPPTAIAASGGFVIGITPTRNGPNGPITGGSVNFLGQLVFPPNTTITGLHIHQGVAGVNGPIVVESGISPTTPLVLTNGSGFVSLTASNVSAQVIENILTNPTGFYVNVHTSTLPAGAIRGQLVRLVETQATTVAMTTAQETPPITTVTASGTGTITANPVRRASDGVVTGGTVVFSIQYDIPPGSVISGLHIHEGPIGVAAAVVINTGVNGTTNSITTVSGKGTLNFEVPITTATLAVFQRLLADPTNFYVNLHTTAFPNGLIRGQLTALTSPPIVQQDDTYFIETGATDATVRLLATGIDLFSTITINGQAVTAIPDLTTGTLTVTVPAALRANAGVLFLQARTTAGLLSTPISIVVAPQASVNNVPATVTDSARFAAGTTPGGIATIFGTKLASQNVASSATPLPTSLDGTSVYVNGVAARLFFVSATQINFLVPVGTLAGPAAVVVVAKDGSITRGTVNITPSAPAIFTRKNDGTGAPAAVASTDGVNFNIGVSNADGTPVAINPGNFVSLFGTGVTYRSSNATATLGGEAVTVLFAGAQGQLAGLDQVNVQIPAGFVGRGDLDLVITIDGRTSNPVKLRIQ